MSDWKNGDRVRTLTRGPKQCARVIGPDPDNDNLVVIAWEGVQTAAAGRFQSVLPNILHRSPRIIEDIVQEAVCMFADPCFDGTCGPCNGAACAMYEAPYRCPAVAAAIIEAAILADREERTR